MKSAAGWNQQSSYRWRDCEQIDHECLQIEMRCPADMSLMKLKFDVIF